MLRRPRPSKGPLFWLLALLGVGTLGAGGFGLMSQGVLPMWGSSETSRAERRTAAGSQDGPSSGQRSPVRGPDARAGAKPGEPHYGVERALASPDGLTEERRAAVARAQTQALARLVERHHQRWHSVPWHRRQRCSDEEGTRHAAFVRAPHPEYEIRADPEVSEEAIALVAREIPKARARAERSLGLDAAPPAFYVYPDLEALRRGSCANGSAVAYYDGAIHLSLLREDPAQTEFVRSLQHEYVHHALIGHGIQEPAWLQEGLAMVLSGERAAHWRPRGGLLPVSEMVTPVPHDADAERTQAHYGQAYAMTRFVQNLCADRKGCGYAELVEGLEYEDATPATLFNWVIDERAGALDKPPISLWESYVANDMRLLPSDAAALRKLAELNSPE